MKTLAVVALKGGVGKSTVVAGLGTALSSMKLKVGFVDLDVTGSNLYSALGLDNSPKWELDTANEKVVVPKVGNYYLLSVASYAGEDNAVLWEVTRQKELERAQRMIRDLMVRTTDGGVNILDGLEAIQREVDNIITSSKWRLVMELFSEDIVFWPEPLDYRLVDLPPSTSNEMFSFFEQSPDIFGVFIVAQPTKLANTGLQRTIDLLKVKQIPILGLVANQDGYLTTKGDQEFQFISPRVDLKIAARDAGIPFLISIPQCGDPSKLKPYFSLLADKITKAVPVVLHDITLGKKLKRKLVKGVARRL
jgi:Mrp family chromosome partitioning ATPase